MPCGPPSEPAPRSVDLDGQGAGVRPAAADQEEVTLRVTFLSPRMTFVSRTPSAAQRRCAAPE